MSQNPVIRIHLLKIRLYRIFTSLESSLQICFAITYCFLWYTATVATAVSKLTTSASNGKKYVMVM